MAALSLGPAARALCAAALMLPVAAPAIDWKWRGRVQAAHERFDGVHTDGGQTRNATWLRRADVSVRGRTGRWQGDLSVDLNTDGDPWLELDEATLSWLGPTGLRFRAGRFDPDFGLEPSGSGFANVAVEDSALWDLAPDAVDGGQAIGAELRQSGRHWHASAALLDQGAHVSSSVRAVAFGQPSPGWWWHLGLSTARQHGWRDDGRIRTRLGVRGVTEDALGRRVTLARAGDFDRDRAVVFEAALRAGPGLLQAEWLQRRLAAVDGGNRHVHGWDLQAAWTLTGQPRHYDTAGARFEAPQGDGAAGPMWEVYVRNTRLAVAGERGARIAALGLNAYLGSQGRASVAWQQTALSEPVGPGLRRGQALMTRWQWRF